MKDGFFGVALALIFALCEVSLIKGGILTSSALLYAFWMAVMIGALCSLKIIGDISLFCSMLLLPFFIGGGWWNVPAMALLASGLCITIAISRFIASQFLIEKRAGWFLGAVMFIVYAAVSFIAVFDSPHLAEYTIVTLSGCFSTLTFLFSRRQLLMV